jgi:hypothetical protein
MNYVVRAVERDRESVHKAVVESLIAFNEARGGPSNFGPITFAIDDEHGQTIGGLSAATAGCSSSCCSCRNLSAGKASART